MPYNNNRRYTRSPSPRQPTWRDVEDAYQRGRQGPQRRGGYRGGYRR